MAGKKSWREKLADSKDLPKVVPIADKMVQRWGSGTIVIAAPVEVDEIMGRIGKGQLVTINQIREALARKHNATIGCPMTTGIFALIAARAAEEAGAAGEKRTTPYWRTLKAKGEVNPKYPGGLDRQRERLEGEGHTLRGRGKKLYVVDFEDSLIELS